MHKFGDRSNNVFNNVWITLIRTAVTAHNAIPMCDTFLKHDRTHSMNA